MHCRHINLKTFVKGAPLAIKSSIYGLALSTSTQLKNSCSALNETVIKIDETVNNTQCGRQNIICCHKKFITSGFNSINKFKNKVKIY